MPPQNQIIVQASLDASEFNRGVQQFVNGLTQLESSARSTASDINQLGTATQAGFGAALGVAAVNSINQLTGSIVALGKEVLQVLKFFEGLTFSIETMIALNMRASDDTLTMADALEAAGTQARSYVLALQNIAIFSPFTTQEIASANRLLQIYGIAADEALGLTKLIVDIASVGGFGAERLNRIGLAVGQIFSEGRLLARDALQLTQAGVPILRFIEQATGKTVGEIQTDMRKGMLSAQVALDALVKGLQDFEGSGLRVVDLAQGLFSSLEDIKEISLRDLFQGVFEGVRPLLRAAVDVGSSTEFRALGTALGQVIGENIESAVSRASAALSAFLRILLSLPPEVINMIAVLTGAAAAIIAFGAAIGLAQLAVFALVNQITLIVGAFTLLVGLWVAGQQRMRDGSKASEEEIAKHILSITGRFENFSKIPSQAITAIARFGDRFASVGEQVIRVVNAIGEAFGNVTKFITDLLSTVVEWGSSLAEVFASGISSGVGAVTGALGFIGSAITGLLKPGSPPKLLPDIDDWGRETAQEWLKGWTEADFDALSDITKTMRETLKSLVDAERLDEVSAVRIIMGSRQDIANAINQITTVGKVAEDTMRRIRRSAGPAAEEVEQLLNAFANLSAAEINLTNAQDELDAITEKYKKTLEPLRKELERIRELTTQDDEENEIFRLRRTIANEAVSARRKEQAQLKIQEILLGRQVRNLEKEKDAAIDGQEAVIDTREKERDLAEEQLSLTQARIDAQNETIKLYGEELKALERLAKEMERLRKKLRDEFLKPFLDEIKRQQLLQKEIADTIALFKAKYDLDRADATEAEKIAAAYKVQSIEAARALRFIELRELGVGQDEIERLREFAVTLADIGIKGNERDFESPDLSAVAAEFAGLAEEFDKAVEAWRVSFGEANEQFKLWLSNLNSLLPPFLQFQTTTGEMAPLFKNLGAAFAGLVAIMVSERFIGILSVLPAKILGVGTPFGLLINALGFFTAAWIGNWFNIRERTADAIEYIQGKFDEITGGQGFAGLLPDTTQITSRFSDVRREFSRLSDDIRVIFKEGISVEQLKAFGESLLASIGNVRDELFHIDLFRGIYDNIAEFVDFITNPNALADAFNQFVANTRSVFAASFERILTADDLSFREVIAKSIGGAAIQFALSIPEWIASFLDGINAFLTGIEPTLGTIFSDFFGKIIPLVLYYFSRSATIIGSALGRLAITSIRLFLTQAVPAFLSSLPRIFGSIAKGILDGIDRVGEDFRQGFLGIALTASALVSVYLGPALIDSIQKILTKVSIGVYAVVKKQSSTFIKSVTTGLTQIKGVGAVVLKAALADIAKLMGQAQRLALVGFSRIQVILSGGLGLIGKGFVGVGRAIINLIRTTLNFLAVSTKVRGSLAFVDGIRIAFMKLGPVLQFLATSVSGVFLKILGSVEQIVKSMPTLLSAIRTVAVGIGGAFSAVIDGIVAAHNAGFRFMNFLGSGGLTNAFKGLAAAPLAAFRGALAGLAKIKSSPIKSISVALKGISTLNLSGITKSFSAISRFFSQTPSTAFANQVRTIMYSFIDFLRRIPALAKNLSAGRIGNIFAGIAKTLTGGFGTALRGAGGGITSIFSSLRNLNVVKSVTSLKTLGTVMQGLRTILSGFLNPISLVIAGLDFFGFAWEKSVNSADESVRKFSDNIKQFWSDLISGQLFEDVTAGFSSFVTRVRELFNIGQEFGFQSEEFLGQFEEIQTNVLTWVKDTGLAIWESITQFWIPVFVEWVGVTIDNLVTSLGSIISTVVGWIETAASWFGEKVRDEWIPAFVNWWTEGGGQEKTVERLNLILDTVGGWIGGSVSFIVEHLATWIPAFVGWLIEVVPPLLLALGELSLALFGWIIDQVPVIYDKFLEWETAFIDWLGPVVGKTISKLGEWIGAILKWIITDGIPGIIKGTIGLIGALISWISGDKDSAEAKVPENLKKFLKALTDFFTEDIGPALYDAGKSIVTAIFDGFKELWEEQLGPFFTERTDQVVDWYNDLGIVKFVRAGFDMAQGILDGIREKIEGAFDFVREMIDFLVLLWNHPELIGKVFDAAIILGENLMKGIGQGILDWITWPAEKLGEAIANLVSRGRELIESNSPSELFSREIGVPIATGISEGISSIDQVEVIERIKGDIESSMKGIGASAIGEVSTMGKGIDKEFNGIRDATNKTVDALGNEVKGRYGVLNTDIDDIMAEVQELLVEHWESISEESIIITDEMNASILEDTGTFIGQMELEYNRLTSAIITEFQQMREDVGTEVDGLIDDLVDALVTSEDSLFNQLLDIFGTYDETNPGISLAKQIVSSISFGLKSITSVNALYNAFLYLIDTTIAKVQDYLGIESPSDLAAELIGKPIALGIAEGITSSVPVIQAAIDGVMTSVSPSTRIEQIFSPRSSTLLPQSVTNNSVRAQEFNLTVNTPAASQGVIQDFSIMQAVAGE